MSNIPKNRQFCTGVAPLKESGKEQGAVRIVLKIRMIRTSKRTASGPHLAPPSDPHRPTFLVLPA